MEEIIKNEHFVERTDKQQQMIDLVSDYFPESGFPDKIEVNKDFILIISRLCDLSIGYQHKNYADKLYSIALYNRKNLAFIAHIAAQYRCYNAVFYEGKIFLATGVYGDYLRGELLCFNIATKELIKCSDENRPVHWLVLNENRLDVYTYKSLGYYESEGQKFRVLNPTEKLFFDFDNEAFELFEEDEIEEIINQDNKEIRLKLLQILIQK